MLIHSYGFNVNSKRIFKRKCKIPDVVVYSLRCPFFLLQLYDQLQQLSPCQNVTVETFLDEMGLENHHHHLVF